MKVTVVGAGNVGATAANVIASAGYASEVVLLDIKEGVSEGKAMDMMQTAKLYQFDCRIKGVTNNYEATADSDVAALIFVVQLDTSDFMSLLWFVPA